MESISFRPGQVFLSSRSPVAPWRVIFEDEGQAGYFYACDMPAGQRALRSGEGAPEETPGVPEASILDAMLVYNVSTLQEPERERLLAVEWSRDGMQAVLYLDGTAQAMVDFQQRRGYCRSNFPNFLEERGERWHRATHAWNDVVFEEFEAALYA